MRHNSWPRFVVHIAAVFALCCSVACAATFDFVALYGDPFPLYVAIADLNGDGKPDFVVGDDYTGIMVYIGNGDGTFTLKAQYSGDAFFLQTGDLNGDGIPDLVASQGAGIQVFLGNGDGTFRAGEFLQFPNIGTNPALGDFNHDGKLDLAVASNETNQVQIFFGNGDGTFQSPVFYSTGIGPKYTLAVDLNHDGNLDLVVTSWGDIYTEPAGISILLGNSDGTFRSRSFIKQPDYTLNLMSKPTWVAAADFDGDGNVDLLVQAMEDATTFVLYGAGDGTFPTTLPVATNALGEMCLAADFDGDGRPDIVCAGNGFTIVTNTGNRTFSPTTYFPGSFNTVAAGDLNGDGKLDLLATGGQLGGSLGVLSYLNSRATTQSVLSIDQMNPLYGQPTHLTAQVNTALSGFNTGCFGVCPVGSVTFFDGSVQLGTTALTLGDNHSGSATYAATFSGGTHALTFTYSGGEMPSTSNTVALQVVPVTAMLTLSSSPPSPVYGANVTIAVTAAAPLPTLAVPTGMVTIRDNGKALASVPLNAAGQASITSAISSGGNHMIQATYSGDADYASSVATTSFTVQPGSVQLTLSCAPNPAASNEPVTCQSQFSNASATGTVTFADGATTLGSTLVVAGETTLNIGTLSPGTHTIQASYSGDTNFASGQAQAFIQVVTPAKQVALVSAADGLPALAPQAIGAAYGSDFTSGVAQAKPGPLPTTLAGLDMTITDATGTKQSALLFFASATQVNFLTPNVAPGPARVQITNASGALFTGPLTVQRVSPALFSANGDGKGVAAGYVVHVDANGVQSTEPLYACGKTPESCAAIPVDLGDSSDQNFLVLYGSGIRNASKVSVLLAGTTTDVVFFGPQGSFAGLDQVNVGIPVSLAGRGDVQIALTADGQSANQLLMQVK